MAEIIDSSSGPITSPTESAPSSTEFGESSSHHGNQSAQLRPRPATDQSANSHEKDNAGNGQNGQQPSTPEAKRESRYERTKRQRAALQQREAALKEREERIAEAERAKNAPKKPDYTLAELKQFRQSWEDEGKFDLVEKADQEIKRLEALEKQEQSQQSFTQEWQTAERELYDADPEFMRQGTRLDGKLREIMAGPDGNVYRGHPRGIVAAYHRAKMELLEGDHKNALGKIQQLETEIKRLNGLMGIGSGAPGRVGAGSRVESVNDFARLSSADMRKHLRSQASRNGDLPWL